MRRYSSSSLRSPKEEQQVPESVDIESLRTKNNVYPSRNADDKIDILDELESLLGIEEGDNLLGDHDDDQLIELNFMEWRGEFPINHEELQYKNDQEHEEYEAAEEEFYEMINKNTSEWLGTREEEEIRYGNNFIKRENSGFEEEEEEEKNNISLNLNLNYQEVMDAWSNRGSLWATGDDSHNYSMANNTFMGEVPVMEEEKTRREAKVLRYKEKRQSRLFSKKIRYQVRKLNAEKRPRLKGRFVKRVSDKIFIR